MQSKREIEEEKAFERLRKEFPGRHVSIEKKWATWYDKASYNAYASEYDDKLYENKGLSSYGKLGTRYTADEAVDTLIERREEEKKRRVEGEKEEEGK